VGPDYIATARLRPNVKPLDLDLLGRLLRFRRLRQRHLENAVLERRLDLVGIDAFGKAKIAFE